MLTTTRLTQLLRTFLAWERAALQEIGMAEPEQSRRIVKLVYSTRGLLDAAGLDVGQPQPELLEALGLARHEAECEAYYGAPEGRRYADAFERLGTGLPQY